MKVCTGCGVAYPLDNFYKTASKCKPCHKAYAIAWQKANPDRVKAHNKKRNPGVWQKQKQDKEYMAKKAIYLKENSQRRTEAAKKWNQANKDKFNLNVAKSHRRRRAKKLDNGWSEYTEDQVLSTYGINCNICNTPIDLTAPRRAGIPGWERGLHIDHLLPICNGGPDTLENVRPTHGQCNLRKSKKGSM